MDETKGCNIDKPDIGQYWEISNGSASFHALVIEMDPYMVQFFEPTATDYRLSDYGRSNLYNCNRLTA